MSDSASSESPTADGRNVCEMSEGHRRIVSTWSHEELLAWDTRRRANQEGSMASVAMAEPIGEDSRPAATGFDPPVACPIAPLPRIASGRVEEVLHFTFINFEEYNSCMKYLRYHTWPSQLRVHGRSEPFDLASRGMREKVENGGDEGLPEHT
ncbi:hypothetical protein B0H13DRAFT_1874454 [Mycena leptocephala]|nr:hypothetical protein B0H13DRAFT_1874454 [Mycena leptocephala]